MTTPFSRFAHHSPKASFWLMKSAWGKPFRCSCSGGGWHEKKLAAQDLPKNFFETVGAFLNPAHFTPYPKNPTICKFLIQIGRYEELGSGVRNVTHYLPFYVPGAAAPSFVDDDMFTVIKPLEAKASVPARGEPGATPQLGTESRLALRKREFPASSRLC